MISGFEAERKPFAAVRSGSLLSLDACTARSDARSVHGRILNLSIKSPENSLFFKAFHPPYVPVSCIPHFIALTSSPFKKSYWKPIFQSEGSLPLDGKRQASQTGTPSPFRLALFSRIPDAPSGLPALPLLLRGPVKAAAPAFSPQGSTPHTGRSGDPDSSRPQYPARSHTHTQRWEAIR